MTNAILEVCPDLIRAQRRGSQIRFLGLPGDGQGHFHRKDYPLPEFEGQVGIKQIKEQGKAFWAKGPA